MKLARITMLTIFAVSLSGIGASVWVRPAVAQQSETRSVTFAVENMTCALCPVTVRKAMEHVVGVRSVAVDLGTKTATVVFDPAVTNPAKIAAASANAGYPASPKA